MIPATVGDKSQNSWSSDPIKQFLCMTKACSSPFFVIWAIMFSCDPLANGTISARVQQESNISS